MRSHSNEKPQLRLQHVKEPDSRLVLLCQGNKADHRDCHHPDSQDQDLYLLVSPVAFAHRVEDYNHNRHIRDYFFSLSYTSCSYSSNIHTKNSAEAQRSFGQSEEQAHGNIETCILS